MTKLEEDLKLAQTTIQDKYKFTDYLSQFYRLWPFTTINMKEYLKPFDLEGKKSLTIQGSSDHIFEMFLKGSEKIIGIDINPLTEYYYYLKLAAFAVLENRDEFLKFFRWYDYPRVCKENREAFDKDKFQEISKYLTGDIKQFWEELFRKYEPLEIRTKLFNDKDEENNRALLQALNYLSPENYEYIRKNRDRINFNFMNVDARNLANELKENIDFMTLSNIIIYADSMFGENSVQKFKELVEDLSRRLNQDGKILVGYLYDIENEEDYRDVYKSAVRDSIFTDSEYSYINVRRIQDLHCERETKKHDACLVYSKRKVLK